MKSKINNMRLLFRKPTIYGMISLLVVKVRKPRNSKMRRNRLIRETVINYKHKVLWGRRSL